MRQLEDLRDLLNEEVTYIPKNTTAVVRTLTCWCDRFFRIAIRTRQYQCALSQIEDENTNIYQASTYFKQSYRYIPVRIKLRQKNIYNCRRKTGIIELSTTKGIPEQEQIDTIN